MSLLTNEDKISIIDQHQRSVEYSKYNLQLSVIEENAIDSPNQETIESLNSQIAEIDKKIAALNAEKESLV